MAVLSANKESFISSFLIWIPYFFFLSYGFVEDLSSTVLNRSGESQYLCLVCRLRGKVFSLSSLGIILAVGFSEIPLSCLGS